MQVQSIKRMYFFIFLSKIQYSFLPQPEELYSFRILSVYSDFHNPARTNRFLAGYFLIERGNPAKHTWNRGTAINGMVVLDGLKKARIIGTYSDVFHLNKTCSSILLRIIDSNVQFIPIFHTSADTKTMFNHSNLLLVFQRLVPSLPPPPSPHSLLTKQQCRRLS